MDDLQKQDVELNVRTEGVAEIKPSAAFDIAKRLLSKPRTEFCTKATPGADLIQIPDHDQFEAARLKKTLDKTSSIDSLLNLERELMIEIERIEAMERVVKESSGATKMRDKVSASCEEVDALFDSVMGQVKKKDRDLETHVQSFRAFLSEAKLSLEPALKKYIYVLNVDPQKLPNYDEFGHAEKFGPIEGLGMIHSSVFGLWVLGTKVTTSDEVHAIGLKALRHTALAIMNLDSEDQIDAAKRRDGRGFRIRAASAVEPRQTAAEINAGDRERTRIDPRDIAWVDRVLSDKEGTERVVLCFSPIRVRLETRYDTEGDIFVPSSYVFGGKVFFVSMVSKKEGIGTSLSQAEKKYGIGSYSIDSDPKYGGYGPFLYDFEGSRNAIEDRPVVVGMLTTGAQTERDMQQSIYHFSGQYTSAGKRPENQIPVVLSYEYLRRIMTVLGMGMIGKPQESRDKIKNSVQALLQKNLMGEDSRMPFSSIKVIDDTKSELGKEINRKGGIRLIVEARSKTVIPDVAVAIMPPASAEAGL